MKSPAATPQPLGTGLRHQRGASYWYWLFTFSVFGFALTAAVKLGPLYVDAYYVEKGLQKLAALDNIHELSNSQIHTNLQRFFTLNNVRGQPTQAIKIIRRSHSMLVSIAYEVRQPLFNNVDVVIQFNKQLNTAKADQCCEPLTHLK